MVSRRGAIAAMNWSAGCEHVAFVAVLVGGEPVAVVVLLELAEEREQRRLEGLEGSWSAAAWRPVPWS